MRAPGSNNTVVHLALGLCLAQATACVETREIPSPQAPAALKPCRPVPPQPIKTHAGPPLTGNIGPHQPPAVDANQPRSSGKLARAVLDYLEKKENAALEPLWRYAARRAVHGDLDHQPDEPAMTLVAASQLMLGKQPRYTSKEQKIVATYLVPRAGDHARLGEMALSVLDRPLQMGKSDTVYRQIKDGHFSLSHDLLKLIKSSGLLKVPAGATVADIGCGVGSQGLQLARAVGSAGKVLAVDVDDGVINFLHHLKRQVPVGDRIFPVKSLLDNVSLERGSVDLALFHGINFLFRAEKAAVPHHAFGLMWSVHGALKPGGHLLIRSYQHTAQLTAFLARSGFTKVDQYKVRNNDVAGPDGTRMVDTLVLYRRQAVAAPRTPGP